jgi:hypothetical protein
MAVLHAYFQWTGLLVWSLVPFDSGVLALTKAVLATDRAEAEARSIRHCANDSGAAELIGVIDTAVPLYLERVDQGALVYPACTQKCTDQNDIQ